MPRALLTEDSAVRPDTCIHHPTRRLPPASAAPARVPVVTCPATRGLVCRARPARPHAPAHAQPLTHSCPGSASRGSLARMRARALGGAGPTPLFPHSFIRSFVRACVRSRVRSLAPAFSPSCAQPPLSRAFIHCRRHSLTRAHGSAPLFTSFVLPGVRPSFIRSRAPARFALSSAHPLPAGPSRPARLAGPCPARPGRAAGRPGWPWARAL